MKATRKWVGAAVGVAVIGTLAVVWLGSRAQDATPTHPRTPARLPKLVTYRGLTFTDAAGGGKLVQAGGCTFFETVSPDTGRRHQTLIAWPHGTRVRAGADGGFVLEYRNQGVIAREGETLRTNAAYHGVHWLLNRRRLVQKEIPPRCDAIRDGILVLVGFHIERPSGTIMLQPPWRHGRSG